MKNVILFTLGNVHVDPSITKYSFPNEFPDEYTNRRSQDLYDALIPFFNIRYWACARDKQRAFSEEKIKMWAETVKYDVLEYLHNQGEEIDFSIQMGGHPNIIQEIPYFIIVDAIPFEKIELLDTIAFPYVYKKQSHIHDELYRNACGIMVHTIVQRYMLRNWLDVDSCKVTAIPPSVNQPQIDPMTYKKEKVILWVGTDFTNKGGDATIEAFLKMQKYDPEYELYMVGTERAINIPGIHVLPFLQREDVHKLEDLYAKAKVFVLPSFKENTGLVYLEALSYSTPVVVTTRGGFAEVVRRTQCGKVAIPGDSKGIFNAITDIVKDEEEYLKYRKKAIEFANQNLQAKIYGERVYDAVHRWLIGDPVKDDYTEYKSIYG